MAGTDPRLVEDLVSLLDLETLEVNMFRGRTSDEGWKRVYGGQVIGQALVAASRTVDEPRPAHSLHAYFIRPGDPNVPILYIVHRDRDGKSFTTRRVVAIQHGQPIFNMAASFQIEEEGLEHQLLDMPDVPAPETVPDDRAFRLAIAERVPEPMRKLWTSERPVEFRYVDRRDPFQPDKRPPHQNVWFRVKGALADDLALHQCMLAYASDMSLLETSTLPHAVTGLSPKLQMASLDHALWFHSRFRADDWLLYSQDSPRAGGARGFTRGSIFTRDGRLVASVAQEGLIRVHD